MVGSRNNEDIRTVNAELKRLEEKIGIDFVEVYDTLCDEQGNLKIDYTTDGLHLSVEGYFAVYKMLKQALI